MSGNIAHDHGDKVFVFSETITPIAERADDVLSISLKSSEALAGQPGLIQSMVTRSEKKGGEICTTTIWKSKQDFQNFMKSDEVAALLKSDDMVNIKAWISEYKMLMSDLVAGWHG
ncbi:hypothetical protein MNBD_ALPHA12-765 [hydrothermal vent metagenome]|uniref:ABM domain-containing protein n=1 Tax=hydrothermal vent metagenome TaxID=652676 RepID=A0A3B0U6V5_9ZZZZ